MKTVSMNLNNRIERLEKENVPGELKAIDRIIVSCREHIDHPERFRKVLLKENVNESGFTTRIYELERINEL